MSKLRLEPQLIYMLSSFRKRKRSRLSNIRRRHVSVYMFCYMIGGTGNVVVNDRVTIPIKPYQLLLFVPGTTIEFGVCDDIDYYMAVFEPLELTGRGRAVAPASIDFAPFWLAAGLVPTRSERLTRVLFERLYREYAGSSPVDPLFVRHQFEKLLLSVMGELSGKQSRDDGIEDSVAYMEEHFADKLDLRMLADIARMEPSSYSRSFKRLKGVSPIEYLTKVRIDRAKKLLAAEEGRVKRVSASVGFPNEFYFSRLFHKTVGLAPTLYMKRKRLNVAVASCLGLQDILASVRAEPALVVDLTKYPWMGEEEHRFVVAAELAKLKQARPDVILGDPYHIRYAELLKPIAPSVMLQVNADWRVNYRKAAELVGREREAERTMSQLELRILEASRLLDDEMRGKRAVVMQVNHLAVRIQGTIGHPLNELLYTELGLKPGKPIPLNRSRVEVQPELLPQLETEYLFIQQHHIRAGCAKTVRTMQEVPYWNGIDAVRRGRVIWIPNWFVMSWSPIGRTRIIDELLAATGAAASTE